MPQYTRYTVTPRRAVAPVWVRVLKWTVLVIVVASAASLGMGVGYLQSALSQVAKSPADRATVKAVKKELTATHTSHEPVNILVLGSDRRVGLAGDKGRSDSIMLIRIDPRTKSISMLSIPRDLRVEIPGWGTDRINAAYSDGGAPLSVETFKTLTGLPVNHFIDINFIGFIDIVDYLGGVYIDADRQYYNDTSRHRLLVDRHPGRLPAPERPRRPQLRALPARSARRLGPHAAPAALPSRAQTAGVALAEPAQAPQADRHGHPPHRLRRLVDQAASVAHPAHPRREHVAHLPDASRRRAHRGGWRRRAAGVADRGGCGRRPVHAPASARLCDDRWASRSPRARSRSPW